jgi:hypothetical protein
MLLAGAVVAGAPAIARADDEDAGAPEPAPAPTPTPEPAPPAVEDAGPPAATPPPPPLPVGNTQERDPHAHPDRDHALLLSVDEALPILSLGSAAPLAPLNAVRVGDPGGFVHPSPPRPIAIDWVFGGGWTIGGAIVVEETLTSNTHRDALTSPLASVGDLHFVGAEARFGRIIPVGRDGGIAIWPRIGAAETLSTDDFGHYASRTDLVLDARVMLQVTPAVALSVGPALAIPLTTLGPKNDAFGTGGDITAEPRLAIAAGITARLDGFAPDADRIRDGRILVTLEDLVPLVRYRVEKLDANGAGVTERSIDLGTADTSGALPRSPRLGAHVRVVKNLTLGGAVSAGWIRISQVASFLPDAGAPSAFVWSVGPRAGWLAPLRETLAIWPRAGITYVDAIAKRPDVGDVPAYHLSADADVLGIWSPSPGVGLALGPTISIPVLGGRHTVTPGSSTGSATDHGGSETFLAFGVTGSIVLFL